MLSEAAVRAKTDNLSGLKESVIVGYLIPAGTGMREFRKRIVWRRDEKERLEESERQMASNFS